MQRYTVYFIWKLLYMFRVIPPPIIRSANNCIYSIWYLSHRVPCAVGGVRHPQHTQTSSNTSTLAAGSSNLWQIPDAVDTVVCALHDGWKYRPKHVEQFSDKINCVTLNLVGHILEYSFVMFTSLSVCTCESVPHFSMKFYIGNFYEHVKKFQIWLKKSKIKGHVACRVKYVLLLPATLNRYSRALSEWNCVRL
jgi:hypothetical protein